MKMLKDTVARSYQKYDVSFYGSSGTSVNNINSTVLALERGLVAPISILAQASFSNVGALAEKSLVLLGGRGWALYQSRLGWGHGKLLFSGCRLLAQRVLCPVEMGIWNIRIEEGAIAGL